MLKRGSSTLPFERTQLWRTAFAGTSNDADVRNFYAGHLRDLRDKARVLVDRIRADMPYLTVHDITHLDALWEIGSTIAGPSYPLTPAEGFVFGAAVLLHDAAMCLAAFPTGLGEIKRTDEWKDTIAMLAAYPSARQPIVVDTLNPSEDIEERAVPIVLRLLHAKQAEDLPRRKWVDALGETEYLIENTDLRDFYGRLIGKVARSHGEPMSWIHSDIGPPLGSLATHDGGEVNGLLLACLLRVADAAHIDARRAPGFERTLTKPRGVSDLHWTFQGKLAKARLEGDALLFSSGSTFSLAEADAWWLYFDAIQVADKELRNVDLALQDASRPRFKARRVRGAESPRDLARDVRTEGWEPVDTRLKVSNVPHLVQMFGGERLYGGDNKVAVRELIQNAADAIRARRRLQPDFAGGSNGEIIVRITESAPGHWLEVEDDGVGMSERTITDTLLDFGRSFWATDAVRSEFPGLMAKGMSPTGKFGIGFFSVFMLGDIVTVTSKRYDFGSRDARTLEFRSGLTLRPILRNATPGEVIPSGGTKISVLLRAAPDDENGILAKKNILGLSLKSDLEGVVAALCPSLDVTVSVVQNNRKVRVIKSDDWQRVDASKLLMRVDPSRNRDELSNYAHNVRPIVSGKTVYGRACIRADQYWRARGSVTVGGFAAMTLEFVEGIFLGNTDVLARNTASLTAPPEALAQWAEEQSSLIARSKIPEEEKLVAAGVVIACGGDPGKLPVGHLNGQYLDRRHLESAVRNMSSITLFEGEPSYSEESDDCHPRDFKDSFCHAADVIFLGEVPGTRFKTFWWKGQPSYWSVLEAILERRWKKYKVERAYETKIGRVGDVEILRGVEIINRET